MKSFRFKIQLHSPYRTNIAENHPNNVTGTLVLVKISVMSMGSRTAPSAKAGANKILIFFYNLPGEGKQGKVGKEGKEGKERKEGK